MDNIEKEEKQKTSKLQEILKNGLSGSNIPSKQIVLSRDQLIKIKKIFDKIRQENENNKQN